MLRGSRPVRPMSAVHSVVSVGESYDAKDALHVLKYGRSGKHVLRFSIGNGGIDGKFMELLT